MEHGNNEDKKCCCCGRKKQRQEKEYKDLVNRLSRIEGQVRGIKRMVEEDAYCTDILMQVSAVNAALNSFNKVLLANHIKTCVRQDILPAERPAPSFPSAPSRSPSSGVKFQIGQGGGGAVVHRQGVVE